MRTTTQIKSVESIESRILQILSKVRNGQYPIYLSLSAMALDFEVQSPTEQQNFNLALKNLLTRGLIRQEQDKKGFKVYRLGAHT